MCFHLGWGKSKDLGLLASVMASYDVIALQEVMRKAPIEELKDELAACVEETEGRQVTWKSTASKLLGRTIYREL